MNMSLIRFHMTNMTKRNEYKFSLLMLGVILTAMFTEECFYLRGIDQSCNISAATGWCFYLDTYENQAGRIFVFVFFGFLASLMYSDFFMTEKQYRIFSISTVRSSGFQEYLRAGGIVIFVGVFLTYLCFFLVSQLLMFILFPADGHFFGHINTPEYRVPITLDMGVFPELRYNFPYLHNLIFIFWSSIWAGILALISFASSFFIKNRLVVLAVPQLLLLFLSMILPMKYQPIYQLYPGVNYMGSSALGFFILPLLLLSGAVAVIWNQTKKGKELIL
ncbi:MAG: hypothetical protein PUC59_04510 [Firmicutes bacterium]|nr:hypothetical protein [Bacillota bacterium]